MGKLPEVQTFPPGFLKKLRDRISNLIAASSANDVPSICRRYGIGDGTREEAMGSKFRYVSSRLSELQNERVLEIGKAVAQEEGDEELLALLGNVEPKQSTPVLGFRPTKRAYYLERSGRTSDAGRLDLSALKTLYKSEYERWRHDGYTQEHFGYWCIDEDFIEGTLGRNLDAKLLFSLGKSGLWPIEDRVMSYNEDDLFSVIEFVFDYISKPLTGTCTAIMNAACTGRLLMAPRGKLSIARA